MKFNEFNMRTVQHLISLTLRLVYVTNMNIGFFR